MRPDAGIDVGCAPLLKILPPAGGQKPRLKAHELVGTECTLAVGFGIGLDPGVHQGDIHACGSHEPAAPVLSAVDGEKRVIKIEDCKLHVVKKRDQYA